MARKTYTQLLYKKQFFYGTDKADYKGWKFFKMPANKWLTVHSELNVVQVSENSFHATLVGYLLDPEKPKADDKEILQSVCRNAKSIDQFIIGTESLGGRWIIFLTLGKQFIVFNDAAGTRSVFYHRDPKGEMWLGTQPGLLVEKFGFVESAESKEYRASSEYIKKVEAWWPGECTPFSEVKQLLPNHLLDLNTGKAERYWPNLPLKKYSLKEGVQKAASILKGVLAGAHYRFHLAMSLSSGNDSRTVFSACKDFAKDMIVFSLKYRHLNSESDDLKIPAQIAEKLNLNYKVIDCTSYKDPEFKKVFDKNVVGLKTDWEQIALARLDQLPADTVVLKGAISEIMRCRYWNLGIYPREVTLDTVVECQNLGTTPMVVNSLKKWMEDALPAEKYGYKLLDLLSWENEVGNWYSMGHAVFDIAQEDFTPFNNRKFYTTMLGINPKYRSYPNHIAQRSIVKYLWPELALFPYTPSRKVPRRRFLVNSFLNFVRPIKKKLTQVR